MTPPRVSAFEDFNREELWEKRTIEPEPAEVTDTTSYDTAPEITEPTERLYRSILEHNNSKKPERKEPTIEINTMTSEERILESTFFPTRDVEMKDGTPKPNELKLSPPKPFTGKRDELDSFLQDVYLYLEVNSSIYDNDKKKIAYVLSFMNDGDAKAWKGQFLNDAMKDSGLNLGTWGQFKIDLKKAFQPFDAPGDALEELTNLKMNNSSIEDHIAHFKILLAKSKVPETSPSAIDYFRRTLNVPLQRKILELPVQPKDLTEWYDWASRLDNNFRRMQRILGRPSGKGKPEPTRRWTFQRKEKDPNAMDIDALTLDKRTDYMKKGLCFGCGKPGHLNKDCPDKKKSTNYSPPSYSPQKKLGAKELYTHIRTLTAQLSEAEKEEFYQEAEKEGF